MVSAACSRHTCRGPDRTWTGLSAAVRCASDSGTVRLSRFCVELADDVFVRRVLANIFSPRINESNGRLADARFPRSRHHVGIRRI